MLLGGLSSRKIIWSGTGIATAGIGVEAGAGATTWAAEGRAQAGGGGAYGGGAAGGGAAEGVGGGLVVGVVVVGAAKIIPEAGTHSTSVPWSNYISNQPILYMSATIVYSLLTEEDCDFT